MEDMSRNVERMEVDKAVVGSSMEGGAESRSQWMESGVNQASAGGSGMLVKLKKALESISMKLGGRKLFRRKEDGIVRIGSKESSAGEGEKEVRVEEVVGSDGEEEVEVRIEEEVSKESDSEVRSVGSGGTSRGFSFLDQLDEEEKVDELEGMIRMGRKRKADTKKESFKIRGLVNTAGWKERAKGSREDPRWCRTVEKEEGGRKECVREKIPLPEDFDLGICIKGMEVNNSSRKNNNMGNNRRALFMGKEGRKGEDKNWIPSFTRAGCVGCRDEKGANNHDGRTSDPVVLVLGD